MVPILVSAAALRSQFHQEAVLTFDYLPQHAPETNAVIITVPDVDIARFRDAFVADSAAHHRLLGGSVPTTDHTLILIAGNADLDITRRLVGAAGGRWSAATIAYGKRELVAQIAPSSPRVGRKACRFPNGDSHGGAEVARGALVASPTRVTGSPG